MAMPASAGTSASTPYTRRPVAPFGACRPATSSTSASAAKAMRWKMHSGHGCRFHWNCEKIAKPTSATHAAKPARHWLRKDQREGFRVTDGRKIGRAHVWTSGTNAQLVYRITCEKKK